MLLSDVCWDCLVCGTHFWTVTDRFQSSFLPQTVLDSCKGSSRAVFRGNHREREMVTWVAKCAPVPVLSRGTAAGLPALVCECWALWSLWKQMKVEAELCTAHKAATLRLLQRFCLIFSNCKAQIPHTALLFGILSQDWCVQIEIFILFYFVRLYCRRVKWAVFNSMRPWFSNLVIIIMGMKLDLLVF